MEVSTLRSNFWEEQSYIQKYLEFLQYKAGVFQKEVAVLTGILGKYGLGPQDRVLFLPSWNGPYALTALQDFYDLLRGSIPRVRAAIQEVEYELSRLEVPEGLRQTDARSFRGEMIQYMIDALENDSLPSTIETARKDLREQLREMAESGDGEPVADEVIDSAVSSAIFILKERKLNELQYLAESAGDVEIAVRMLRPDTELHVLRQGFILLMTIFDATIFDLMRVALRRDFFGLVGAFGKHDKVPLEDFAKYSSYEEFRDQIIEDQLRGKYLKDLLAILEAQKVELVDPATEDRTIHLRELVQRRNVHVHNRGRVDDRYLERDSHGVARYNIYNLAPGSFAEVDLPYWERANRLCQACVTRVAAWVDTL
jgi:hypothetical protein